MTVRFVERHLLLTVTEYMRDQLTTLGWVNDPTNFGAPSLTIINEHPDTDNDVQVLPQTLAITLGDTAQELPEQLGGGLYCLPIPVFFDVYGDNSSVAVALASDVRDLLKRWTTIDYKEYMTAGGVPVVGALIQFDKVVGPERPPASQQAASGDFRKHWRVVKSIAQVEYND